MVKTSANICKKDLEIISLLFVLQLNKESIVKKIANLNAVKSFPLVVQLGDVAVFENRKPVTEAKFINKSSLSILLPVLFVGWS